MIKEGELATAFQDMMKVVVDKTVDYIESKSPSQLTKRLIGVPMIDGIIAGIKSKPEELTKCSSRGNNNSTQRPWFKRRTNTSYFTKLERSRYGGFY